MMVPPVNDIITNRLILRLMKPKVISACLDGDIARVELLLGVKVPAELLDNLSGLRYNQQQLAADPDYMPWSTRAIILTGENSMIGIVRFHSAPDPEYLHLYTCNAVELGYRVFSGYRRMGYAKETVKAVFKWASVNFGITNFVVSVSPTNIPSLNLINDFGFIKVDEVMDETDGPEHVFLLNSNLTAK